MPPLRLVVLLSSGRLICTSIGIALARAGRNDRAHEHERGRLARVVEQLAQVPGQSRVLLEAVSSMMRQPPGWCAAAGAGQVVNQSDTADHDRLGVADRGLAADGGGGIEFGNRVIADLGTTLNLVLPPPRSMTTGQPGDADGRGQGQELPPVNAGQHPGPVHARFLAWSLRERRAAIPPNRRRRVSMSRLSREE